MKEKLALLLALATVMSMTACGAKTDDAVADATTTAAQEQTTEAEEDTKAETEAKTEVEETPTAEETTTTESEIETGSEIIMVTPPIEDFEYEYNRKEDFVTITRYKGEELGVIIPETIDGHTVKKLDGQVFGASDVVKLEIPDCVTDIQNGALNSSTLIEIKLPSTLATIGDNAFSYCEAIKTIELPSTVTSIGDGAFNGCKALETIIIPESVTSIGKEAFWSCGSLKSIVIPDGITEISEGTFGYCYNLSEITLPNTITYIGRYAFSDCSSLTNISLPKNLEMIGGAAFSSCENLTEISIPDNVKYIHCDAFEFCFNLVNVTLGDNVIMPYGVFNNGNEDSYNHDLIITYKGKQYYFEDEAEALYNAIFETHGDNFESLFYERQQAYLDKG